MSAKPDPSAYPIGSLQSRAAARKLLQVRTGMQFTIVFVNPDMTISGTLTLG